jgi:lipopolysaccharide export system permease protein
VFGNILFRMILWELVKVFLMALIGITGILLMAGIVAEATQQGLGPAHILAAIPLIIPSTLPYTIPATTLFAACVVYGRLAADNEILAIKAAGINIVHVVKPGLILGITMTAFTMGLYYHLIPYTHFLLRSMVFADAEELVYSVLRRHGTINYPQMSWSMFVKGVQGRKLISPVVKRRVNGGTDLVAQAKEADLCVDMSKKLILVHMRYGVATCEDGSRAYFEDRVWEVPLPDKSSAEVNKRPRAMTWNEVLARRQQYREELAGIEKEIVQLESEMRKEREPSEHLVNQMNSLRFREDIAQQRGLELDVELLMRPALALGCFCFILVGCPVGIWFSKSDFLSAFITCFLPICIVYYPLMLCGTNMAKEGKLEPLPLVWAANICMGTIGICLFAKLVRN